jgi:hypothetical protein
MGGTRRPDTDSLANLLALDPDVHNGGPMSVHGRRAWSEEHGFLVPKATDFAISWPVNLRLTGRWVFLLSNGQYRDIPRS